MIRSKLRTDWIGHLYRHAIQPENYRKIKSGSFEFLNPDLDLRGALAPKLDILAVGFHRASRVTRVFIGHAQVQVTQRIGWINSQQLTEILDRLLVVVSADLKRGKIVVGFKVIRVTADGLTVVLTRNFRAIEPFMIVGPSSGGAWPEFGKRSSACR